MTNTRGELFKHLLSRYISYHKRIDELMQMLDATVYQQMNVKGISSEQVAVTASPVYESSVIRYMAQKDAIVKEIQMLSSMIEFVEETMKEFDEEEQLMIREHYIDGMSYKAMADKRGVTRRAVEHSFEKIFSTLC